MCVYVHTLHTVELHGTILKFHSFDEDYFYWHGKYGQDIKSSGEFYINFPSQTVENGEKSSTGFPMNYVTDAVNILKSTYQKHLAESISINTKFFLFVHNFLL